MLSIVFGSSFSEYLDFFFFFYILKSLSHFSFYLFPHDVYHGRFDVRMHMSSLTGWLLWNNFIDHFLRYKNLAMRGMDFKSLLLKDALFNPLVVVGIIGVEGF